jgi:chemotaxis protein MotA
VFAIIGIVLVFGAVIGGFLMEKGHLAVLVQPAEVLIIAGAALGTLLTANPLHILKQIVGAMLGTLGGSKFTKLRYLATLKMMFDLMNKVRRGGLLSIEGDIERPEESEIFLAYPEFLKDHHVCHFVCDTMRMIVTGGIDPFDMDQMMERDMEVCHHGATAPISALSTVADALPGLGIVAAVLGVVITMGALSGPPEELGKKVAAALVGTFLGILMCYGVVGPLSSNMAKIAEDEHSYMYMLRVLMLAAMKDNAPQIVVEVARRAIPAHVRPTFEELETACRGEGAAPASSDKEAA